MNWKLSLMIVITSLSLNLNSTESLAQTCDSLLTECATLVDDQQMTLDAKNQQIKAMDLKTQNDEAEIDRAHKAEDNAMKFVIGEGALILLLLLL